MKHTYLYPLPDDAVFLWRLGRTSASDLFGLPGEPDEQWMTLITLDDAFGTARETVMRLIEDADRVCLGRRYVVPGSLDPASPEVEEGVERATREVTHLLWDAPLLSGELTARVLATLSSGRAPGRDPLVDIAAFLRAHDGRRVIPVWM
ncbi:hypothetical protein ACPCKW_22495 [Streptomyces griseoincarnatus]